MAQAYHGANVRPAVIAGLALFLAVFSPSAHAQGPLRGLDCIRPEGALALGQTQPLAADASASFAMELDEVERIEIDLDGASAAIDPAAPVPLEICDPAGVPIAGELVPGSGGHVTLRFVAPAAGRYVVAVVADPAPRTITLRAGSAPAADAAPLVPGRTVFARLAPRAVRAWSFEGKAGQWMRIAAASEGGIALRLITPAASGSEETNEGRSPLFQRKLPADGTYRVEVQSLADTAEDMTLDVRDLPAAPPPAPIAALTPGAPVRGALGEATDAALYDIAVKGGRTYQVEASAMFDLALDLGLPDPLEPAGGAPASGISVQRSVDATRTGAEILTFTAAGDGRVLVRIRGAGSFDSGEVYTVTLTETGG